MEKSYRPFFLFTFLSLLLLVLVPILGAISGVGMDFSDMATRASVESGIPWTSNLWNLIRLAAYEPGLWLLVLGSGVPTFAALATLAAMTSEGRWGAFFSRFNPLRGVSVGSALLIYSTLIISLITCLLLIGFLRHWLWSEIYPGINWAWNFGLVATILSAAFLDQGAVLEEGGWRGFATPFLQALGVNPLKTALFVGLVWAFWHVPRDVVSGVAGRQGLVTYLVFYLPAFTLGCIAVSVIASWAMNRLNGSIIPAIVVHGLANDAMGFSGAVTIDQALTPIHQITKALPLMGLGLILLIFEGVELGRKKAYPDK